MTPTERQSLMSTLAQAGQPLLELPAAGGGSALILPYGGRVLGLFTADDAPNHFWVHPQLMEVTLAQQVFRKRDWINLGGDRTWLGAEQDLNRGDLAAPLGAYLPPQSLDPGEWRLARQGQVVTMSLQGRVPIKRRRVYADVVIERAVSMIPNPLRREAAARELLAGVEYVGYEQETVLSLVSCADKGAQMGIWNLIVLPTGGWIIVPTLGRPAVRDFFPSTAPGRVQIKEHAIHFLLDGRAQHKIGLRAAELIGRAGYLRAEADGRWTLVVRAFGLNPSGDYIDIPPDDEHDLGYAFEAYNDDGKLGDFGELEYHAPAIGGDTGLVAARECSQVWAYRGTEKAIRRVAERLLGEGTV